MNTRWKVCSVMKCCRVAWLLTWSQPMWSHSPEIFRWREEYLTPTNFVLLIVTVSAESVMIPLTVFGNILVIFLVWRKRYLPKQKPCVLLACLAAADLLVGAVILPLMIAGHAMRLSRVPVCLVDAVTVESIYVVCGASLYHLVIISAERHVAIKHALRYETLVTTRRLTAAVATAWAIPVVSVLSAWSVVLINDSKLIKTELHRCSCLPQLPVISQCDWLMRRGK